MAGEQVLAALVTAQCDSMQFGVVCDAMRCLRCDVVCDVVWQEGKAAAASLQEEMEARAA
jgi:hypothetical protein